MNFRAIAIVVFLIISGVSSSIYFRQKSVVVKEGDSKVPVVETGIPIPIKTGPLPKAVVDGPMEHDFGTMEQGQKGEHSFTIRNDGKVPMELVARKEDHSCQCTLGSLGANGLKPGESTIVKLSWEIKNPAPVFQHWAKIRTNDPDNLELMFRVKGIVGQRLVAKPGTEIPLGLISEGKTITRTLTLHSDIVDKFEIKKIESSSPLITVEHRPMTEDERREVLKEVAMQLMSSTNTAHDHKPGEKHNHADDDPGDPSKSPPSPLAVVFTPEMIAKAPKAKSGYQLTLSIKPEMAIGKFRESVTLHTDIEKYESITIYIDGARPGPTQILATPGIGWAPEESLVRLPRFPAKEGKKAKLLLFLNKNTGDQKFELSKLSVNPPTLKCEVIRDEKFKGMGREKYDILIEVPAGSTPATFNRTNRGFIEFDTNHSDLKSIRFELEYTSF